MVRSEGLRQSQSALTKAQGSELASHSCQGAGGSEQGPKTPVQSQVRKMLCEQGPHTGAQLPGRAPVPISWGGRYRAHRTDEASVMPAESQRLQEPVSSINLEVTATALGTKHLLIVCEERQRPGQRSHRSRAAAQPRSHEHSLWKIHCQPQGRQCPGHPGEMPVQHRVAAGRRQTSSPRMLCSPLMYILHHLHGNTGPTALPSGSQGGLGWNAQNCKRGIPTFPMSQGEPCSARQLMPHPCGLLLSPYGAPCPRAMKSDTHGPWVLPLSQ